MPKKDKVKIERNVKKDDKKESSASKDKQKEGIYEFFFFFQAKWIVIFHIVTKLCTISLSVMTFISVISSFK